MSKDYNVNKEFKINNDGVLEDVLTESREVHVI